MKVFILGAGASFGHAAPAEARPPMATQFFQHARDVGIDDEYDGLFRYLKSVHSVDVDGVAPANIETVFGAVQNRWERDGFRRNRAALVDLLGRDFMYVDGLDMLRSFVTDCVYAGTAWLTRERCPLHDWIALHWAGHEDVVISFNYDLIADRSFERRSDWSEAVSYGFVPRHTPTIDAQLRSIDDWSKGARLLKPHGSMNWFRAQTKTQGSSLLKSTSAEANTEIEFDTIEVALVRHAAVGQRGSDEDTRYVHAAPRHIRIFAELERTLPLDKRWWLTPGHPFAREWTDRDSPLLVMPTPFKDARSLAYAQLKDVWAAIDESLAEATEIVACGFAFNDPHFNQALVESAALRRTPIQLTIIHGGDDKEYDAIAARLSSPHLIVTRWRHGWLKEYVAQNEHSVTESA